MTLFAKIFLMAVVLLGVVWAIQSLNTQSIEKAFESLGLQMGDASSPGLKAAGKSPRQDEDKMNLCPTRIVSIDFGRFGKIEESQKGLKVAWMVVDPQPREITTLDMEKWLTSHCLVVVKRMLSNPETKGSLKDHELIINYVDKSSLVLKVLGGNT